jgi:hypothetical protein
MEYHVALHLMPCLAALALDEFLPNPFSKSVLIVHGLLIVSSTSTMSYITYFLYYLKQLAKFLVKKAYPFPECIDIHCGKQGTIENYILSTLLREACLTSKRPVIVLQNRKEDAPFISVDEEVFPGFQACSRFLSKMSETYPTDPVSCLCIDSSLEDLCTLIMTTKLKDEEEEHSKIRAAVLDILEPSLIESEWIFNFPSSTVADDAWFHFLEWCETNIKFTVPSCNQAPNFYTWYTKSKAEKSLTNEDDIEEEANENLEPVRGETDE